MAKAVQIEDIIGWFGTSLILGAYCAGVLGIIAPTSMLYQACNIIASFALMYIAIKKNVTELVVLNLLWGAIGVVTLFAVLL